MKVLAVNIYNESNTPTKVGRLAFDGSSRQGYFEYAPEFLEAGITLSPPGLRSGLVFEPGLQGAGVTPFSNIHGVFADSLPDGWGLLLMDRALRLSGVDVSEITPIDRLAFVGSRAVGALSYEPDTGSEYVSQSASMLNIQALAEEAVAVFDGSVEDVTAELVEIGASPQGARPKALVGLSDDRRKLIVGSQELPEDFSHWLVKFPSGKDAESKAEGAVEYLYSSMARKSGIDMPATELLEDSSGNNYFAVKRFDRLSGNRRIHMQSMAGLLNVNFRVANSDYEHLIKLGTVLTRNNEAVTELCRRMIFNVVTGNRDDHTKNFAFLMGASGEWRNTPAYDLTYNTGIYGEHTMSVAGKGKGITLDDICTITKLANLSVKETQRIVESVCDSTRGFKTEALNLGATRGQVNEISGYIEKCISCLTPAVISVKKSNKSDSSKKDIERKAPSSGPSLG